MLEPHYCNGAALRPLKPLETRPVGTRIMGNGSQPQGRAISNPSVNPIYTRRRIRHFLTQSFHEYSWNLSGYIQLSTTARACGHLFLSSIPAGGNLISYYLTIVKVLIFICGSESLLVIHLTLAWVEHKRRKENKLIKMTAQKGKYYCGPLMIVPPLVINFCCEVLNGLL